MTEIDWEAAKSGKRPVKRVDGSPCRYLGALGGDVHAIAVRVGGEHEIAVMCRDDGTCINSVSRLIQDPEVIEFKRWVNVYPHKLGNFFDSQQEAAHNAADDLITIAPLTIRLTIRITGDKVEISGGTE